MTNETSAFKLRRLQRKTGFEKAKTTKIRRETLMSKPEHGTLSMQKYQEQNMKRQRQYKATRQQSGNSTKTIHRNINDDVKKDTKIPMNAEKQAICLQHRNHSKKHYRGCIKRHK
jgi:hypothetical protein